MITDIHGAYLALTQVLERAEFDPSEDKLIFLGDVCDGWPYVTECIEFLSDVPNLVQLMGNHDLWTKAYLMQLVGKGYFDSGEYRSWYDQGGCTTIDSMRKHDSHDFVLDFLSKSIAYYESKDNLFVHGGISPDSLASDNSMEYIVWDRNMVRDARYAALDSTLFVSHYNMVYCGHTPTLTTIEDDPVPIKNNNVYELDTGASYGGDWKGKLTVLCVGTGEYWQSDVVQDLYPGESGR